ncbi:PREDICTED: uncharacterized protein LOC109152017 [Ipomoea nil]|uniref:uncharacterized protein LOC109152017 n=1 Tax=Ipomoea nil TaxID=35883 RepID=UPI000900F464|nr:PREDICTED: uncharacterized protein LOC109152017 [Ipomoea nil]XP_019155147.1 PREDICTED: uncharacterized protein LOC109152017 [Ipomoea nil]
MGLRIVSFVQNLWPFSIFKHDDLRISEGLVRKLSIPDCTKQFVYAIPEPESDAVIYVVCVQNLSEQSAMDAQCLIREIRPDAVVVQVDNMTNEPHRDESGSENDKGFMKFIFAGENDEDCEENAVPTSAIEVLKRCFMHKINKEKYENVAGNLVLREIFGVGFDGYFLAAKKAAEDVGSTLLLLDSPLVKCNEENECSSVGNEGYHNGFGVLGLKPFNNMFPQRTPQIIMPVNWQGFFLTNDIQTRMVKLLSSHLVNLTSVANESENIHPQIQYEAPQFAQSVYPLLADLHDIFVDIPSIGRALASSQKLLNGVSRGEMVNAELLSEVYIFRIAVEVLRIALNNAGRLPISKIGNANDGFSELSIDEKSHALVAQALRSQTKKFKSIVAVVDASSLAGIRKHWNTRIPMDIKDIVEHLVTNRDSGETSNTDRKSLLSGKPVVAVGAGATAAIGASSLSKVVPLSTIMKVVTFKLPASLKLMMTQTQKAAAILLGKSPGMASSGLKSSSVLKAAASTEKIRAVAHSIIASAEKTSLSAMRSAFYEIMRKRHIRRIGYLPWATFGCSIATCTGLLVYGDGIECAVESFPAAPSIARLGRGIQRLHEASQAVRQSEKAYSLESLLYRFNKIKVQ